MRVYQTGEWFNDMPAETTRTIRDWIKEFGGSWDETSNALLAWRRGVLSRRGEDLETAKRIVELNPLFHDLTRVLMTWADTRLRIDPTPLGFLAAMLDSLKYQYHPSYDEDGNLIHDDPPSCLKGADEQFEDAVVRALICWERVYHASEICFPPEQSAVGGKKRRKIFYRNRYFLELKRKGLTPAKIRDKWNGMSDDERQLIGYDAWQKISLKTKDNGRDTVKKAIERPKKPKKRNLSSVSPVCPR